MKALRLHAIESRKEDRHELDQANDARRKGSCCMPNLLMLAVCLVAGIALRCSARMPDNAVDSLVFK
jgi:hypothetical protein